MVTVSQAHLVTDSYILIRVKYFYMKKLLKPIC
jgi:hypothetical protein